jgi:hypothetical protein
MPCYSEEAGRYLDVPGFDAYKNFIMDWFKEARAAGAFELKLKETPKLPDLQL